MSGIIYLPVRWCEWGRSSICKFSFSMQKLDWYNLNSFFNISNNISFSYINIVVVWCFNPWFPSYDFGLFRGFLPEVFGGFNHLHKKKEWQERTWFHQQCSLGSRNLTEIGDSDRKKHFDKGAYGDTIWVLKDTLFLSVLLHI